MESNPLAVGLGMVAILGAVAILAGLVAVIFYCLTLQKALGRVSPENRKLAPGLVWLLLLPLAVSTPLAFLTSLKILQFAVGIFGLVWNFVVVLQLAASLGAEFKKRSLPGPAAPGKPVGLAMCILCCCMPIPLLGVVAAIGGLVCWIIYWVKIAGFSGKLAAPAA